MPELFDANQVRKPAHPVEPLLVSRWSPRAMSGEPLTDPEISSLFEAARWAPSCFNEQPWRFLYAKRDTPHWETFLGLLVEVNRSWCQKAGLLGVVVSKTTFTRNNKPNRTHAFDAGLAYENLALQGTALGLVVHGMAGFDYAKAKKELEIPDDFDVHAMFTVGRPGNPDELPEGLKERETPSDRKPTTETIREGKFSF